METVKDIRHLFDTADAEGVTFRFDGADLVVNFTDWHDRKQEVTFPDAIYVAWGGEADSRLRIDSPYEIVNSERIQNLPDQEIGRHHYMLCFNAASNLEVMSQELRVRKMEN